MLIFWRLMLGHMLADFTLQSNFINAWKRRSHWGMLVHCGMHPAAYASLTWPYLGQGWISLPWLNLPGWACVLLIFFLHYAEDEWRVFTIFRYSAPDSALFFVWDQIIHCVSIFVFVPVSVFSDLGMQGLIPEKWPVLGCLAVGVTHFCTVVIYFIEKDLYGSDFPEFSEKYLLMAARLALALCFLLPGTWWAAPALLWAINVFYLRRRRVIDYSWLSLGLGGGVSIAFGLLARVLWYA